MAVSAPHGTPVAARPEPPSTGVPRRRLGGPWLLVGALTVVGALLRAALAGQSLFADELSTYWLVSAHDLPSMLATIRDSIEITPPLSFVLSWLTTRVDLTPELLRLPALLAGIATIPLTYALGVRTVGRAAGVLGAALVAFSPFLIYYSTEARNYQVLVLLGVLSTLSLLAAVERRRMRWWAAYGVCSSLAMYTHYTAAFTLAVQLVWVLWSHPEARRPAIVANLAAAVAFVPWIPGMLNDFRSPDVDLMTLLMPFSPMQIRLTIEHWSVGYPLVRPNTELRDLPGVRALALMALGLATAIVATAWRHRRAPRVDRKIVLIAALALAAPAGEAVLAALGGPKLFAPRNMAASWPAFALGLSALLLAAGPRLRVATVACVLAGFVVGGVKMLGTDFERPDFKSAAAYVDRAAAPGDPVLDAAVLFFTPGPVTPLDATLRRSHRTMRVGASERRDGNFRVSDPVLMPPGAARRATASGRRVFVVTPEPTQSPGAPVWDPLFAHAPHPYRRVEERVYDGYIPLAVLVYEPVR